jgi:hypothetical protein
MGEILFQAIPAYAIQTTSDVVSVWCGDAPPSGTPARLVGIDFSKTPTRAGTAAQVDDPRGAGGFTDIHPGGAGTGGTSYLGGALYYAVSYASPSLSECLSTGRSEAPYADQDYQYQCLVRIAADGTIRRYHGYRATIVDASSPTRVTLDIYQAGDSEPRWRGVTVNLNDEASCLPPGAYTKLDPGTSGQIALARSRLVAPRAPRASARRPGVASAVASEPAGEPVLDGAIFLSQELIDKAGLVGPKVPPGC